MKNIEDIEDIIIKKEEGTRCHIVQKQKGVHFKEEGYGLVSFQGKRQSLHRLSYKYFKCNISKDRIVRHSCDNPSCINPAHLISGTKKQNTQDMMKHNRHAKWDDRPMNQNGRRSRQKLSNEQVAEIKHSKLSSYKLAGLYPVSSVQIRRIKNGTRCKNPNKS
jgi:hypothetical protein